MKNVDASQNFIALQEDLFGPLEHDLDRPLRVLLIKPFQKMDPIIYSPPLGLLYLASSLRHRFGSRVDVRVFDMKIENLEPEKVLPVLDDYKPDVLGVSALNCEAHASYDLARIAKSWCKDVLTVIGGPFALRQAEMIFSESVFDWVIGGSGERNFTEALARNFSGQPLGKDLPGLSWRDAGDVTISHSQENISNLDDIPKPAWDLVNLEAYGKKPSFGTMLTEDKYALLFTSRGCPYLCSYCHDIFSKKFVYQSAQSVIEDIEILYEQFGVREFQVVDDIFNLHKPRVKAIMHEVNRRWPGELKFTFPNGLRADVLDQETIDALALGGGYLASVAVETVTPRLQKLVQKNLDIEKTAWAIDALEAAGISVNGFFMLGFPTETPEEIQATIDFALKSDLTLACFFTVVPQPETPLYELAKEINPEALAVVSQNEKEDSSYRDSASWYQLAYGYELEKTLRWANIRFFFSFKRVYKVLKAWPIKSFLLYLLPFIKMITPSSSSASTAVPKPE